MKILYLLLLVFGSLHANEPIEDDDDETEEYLEEPDFWFGPGFYYGVWFDNEDDYWQWRGNHKDYPPNHHYYNKDHPIYYNRGDEQPREREQPRDFHGAPGRGGGGMRGGGGHR